MSPDRLPAPSGSLRACGARCLGPASPERILSPRFLRCVSVLLSAVADRAQRPRAGVESPARRGLPPFPPPQATPPGAGAGPEGVRGGRPAGAEGPRPRVRSEGGPEEGGKGTKAGGGRRGPAGRPWRRGASRPLMNINRACGLARPGRARRPARVPAPARRRAAQAGPGGLGRERSLGELTFQPSRPTRIPPGLGVTPRRRGTAVCSWPR
ncbi:translation initiation factor IF-2-like [Herpailurus yagouaroundi]|uniref:translation initiation factor IF-2-like n=1 Tax=Herpailurus yagouaroundi TaxID=1608482 RepID=UPI001AD6A7E4|nr:translation initiation factor IF-2-like [Puma yagouaroundi]